MKENKKELVYMLEFLIQSNNELLSYGKSEIRNTDKELIIKQLNLNNIMLRDILLYVNNM